MANALDLVDEPLQFPSSNIPENKFFIQHFFSPITVEYYFKNYPGYEITQTKTFIKVVTNYFLFVYAFLNRVQSQYKVVCMHTGILPSYNFVPLKMTPFTELQEATKKSSKVKNSTLKKNLKGEFVVIQPRIGKHLATAHEK